MTATSGMRVPVVAGVGGGVGTTTVAVGLRGHDGGRTAGRRPDILVCCDTLDSMQRAAEVLDAAGPEPPPVLAVTLAGRTLRGALRQRLELLEPDAAGLVLLPHVRRWSTLPDPLAEVARLLVDPADRLPRPVRAYAAALRAQAAATGLGFEDLLRLSLVEADRRGDLRARVSAFRREVLEHRRRNALTRARRSPRRSASTRLRRSRSSNPNPVAAAWARSAAA